MAPIELIDVNGFGFGDSYDSTVDSSDYSDLEAACTDFKVVCPTDLTQAVSLDNLVWNL